MSLLRFLLRFLLDLLALYRIPTFERQRHSNVARGRVQLGVTITDHAKAGAISCFCRCGVILQAAQKRGSHFW